MKRIFSILGLSVLAVLLMGQVVYEGKFTIKIDQWHGLNSDELYSRDLSYAKDMLNLDVGVEGANTYLQQREGYRRVFLKLPVSSGLISIGLFQPSADSERIVAGVLNGDYYTTTGLSDTWRALTGRGVGGVAVYNNFTQFKDTLIVRGGGIAGTTTYLMAKASGLFKIVASLGGNWNFGRMLLHQDRIYGYGLSAGYGSSQLAWMPEFSLQFDRWQNLVDSNLNAGFFYVNLNDGDFITNIIPMDNHLIVYKSRSIYRVLISPETNAPAEVIKIADRIGAFGYNAATEYNGVQYFIAQDGVYSLDGVHVTKLSTPINNVFSDSLAVTSGSNGIFKIAFLKNRLYCLIPIQTGNNHSRWYIYDLETKTWVKYILNRNPTSSEESIVPLVRYDFNSSSTSYILNGVGFYIDGFRISRLIFGYDSTNVGLLNIFPGGTWADADQDSNGLLDSISWFYQTGISPLGEMWKRKQFERVLTYAWIDNLAGGSTGESTRRRQGFNIDWYSDRNQATLWTTRDSIVSNIYVGGGVYSTDGEFLRNYRINPIVSGSLLGYKISGTGGGVKINAMEIIGSEKGMADDTE